MEISPSDFEKLFKNKSSKHHYIPQFLIKGFVNNEGLLYIYDKARDTIQKKPKSPSAIFFENDRNTIEVTDDLKSSFIEDVLYGDVDNKISKLIKSYQKDDIGVIDHTIEDTTAMQFFLVVLFWRLPKTDHAADDLMTHSEIKAVGIDPEILRQDPTFRKMQRVGLFKHHIDEIRRIGLKGHQYFDIYQTKRPCYVIGDFPFLCKNLSSEFGRFFENDIYMAISSQRIYTITNQKLEKFPLINSLNYNAAIIEQSVKYVACGDLNVLKQSVEYYRELKKSGKNYIIGRMTFDI